MYKLWICEFDKFLGKKENNKSYQELKENMQRWSKESNNRIWIPAIITLPTAMLYPFDDEDGKMMWAYAEMIDISEEDRKNYPKPDGGFYEKTYNVDNPTVYKTFFEGMLFINQDAKQKAEQSESIKLPKLKKL